VASAEGPFFLYGQGQGLGLLPAFICDDRLSVFLRYETGDRQWNQLNVSAALKMPMNRLVLRG
jgi:hypothetical protein